MESIYVAIKSCKSFGDDLRETCVVVALSLRLLVWLYKMVDVLTNYIFWLEWIITVLVVLEN